MKNKNLKSNVCDTAESLRNKKISCYKLNIKEPTTILE